jgi:integrase
MFSGDDPISGVNLPPEPGRTSHNLTIVETKAILRLMRYPEREIALITITTGLSVSEICALQWKHVNLTRSSIFIEGRLLPPSSILLIRQWDASGLVDVDAKRVRTVIVPEPLVNLLLKIRRNRTIADKNGFLMAGHDGEPIRPASIRMRRLKPIGRTLDMPWLSWQVLRRGHEELLSELRISLTSDLVLTPSATGM